MNGLEQDYISWMMSLISNEEHDPYDYELVLSNLYYTDFVWSIAMDANRADDGIELRYRFAVENDIEQPVACSILDSKDCSILEMMVALSLRIEDDIMQGTEERHVDKWFWVMMNSLGLDIYNDYNYYAIGVNDIIDKFSNRLYEPTGGTGSLFTIPGCVHDLRYTEIWYQMQFYLEYISKGE